MVLNLLLCHHYIVLGQIKNCIEVLEVFLVIVFSIYSNDYLELLQGYNDKPAPNMTLKNLNCLISYS